MHYRQKNVDLRLRQRLFLGPLLFLLYINDIQHACVHATPTLFAEDINLFLFHKDMKSLYSIANTKLDSLTEWLLANKQSLTIK